MLHPPNPAHLHLWIPNIFGFKGGIQVYSAFFLEALQKLFPNTNYDVFLKHDTYASTELSFLAHTRFHLAGSFPPALRTPAFALQLLGYGLWQKPNLVITTHLNFTIAAYWLKRLTGIPYWAIAHGVDAWNIERPMLKTALQQADCILAVSSYTRDRLLKEQNLSPDRVKLLPNTFDPSRFTIAPKPAYLLKRHNLSSEQHTILTVTRLSNSDGYKGYDQLIQALPQIRQSIPNVHYILVGKGDDQHRVEQLVRDHSLQNHVTLAGFIPDSELCDYYNLCDVFALPSKGEGFGIVYLEALACGKPTLGGNQDGAIDALGHGDLGALVNPDDLEEIAQTLMQVLNGTSPDPKLYKPEVLRQKVIEKFGFERFQQSLAEYLACYFSSANR